MGDVETGLNSIEDLRGAQNSQEPESEVRSRDLPVHTQKVFYDIIKYDLRAKPGKLRKWLEEEMTLDMRTPSWTEFYLDMFKKGDSMHVHSSGGDGLDPSEI